MRNSLRGRKGDWIVWSLLALMAGGVLAVFPTLLSAALGYTPTLWTLLIYAVLFAIQLLLIGYWNTIKQWLIRLRRRIAWFGGWKLVSVLTFMTTGITSLVGSFAAFPRPGYSAKAPWEPLGSVMNFQGVALLCVGLVSLAVTVLIAEGTLTLSTFHQKKLNESLTEKRFQAQQFLRETAEALSREVGYREQAACLVSENDLLDLAEQGDTRLNRETIQCIRIATQTVEQTNFQLARLRARFHVPVPEDVPLQPEEIEAMQAERESKRRQVAR